MEFSALSLWPPYWQPGVRVEPVGVFPFFVPTDPKHTGPCSALPLTGKVRGRCRFCGILSAITVATILVTLCTVEQPFRVPPFSFRPAPDSAGPCSALP